MKISNKKIIVSTLALAMGAALAGSISGSVAWYQYSTRAAAQISGTTAGTEGRLQVKLGEDGTYSQKANQPATNQTFKPTSISGEIGSYTYYDHPVYQVASLPADADPENNLLVREYSLFFKFEESTTNPQEFVQQEKNVYLTYFAIENAGQNDISSAVRVELVGTTNSFLLSKDSLGQTVTTHGALDLNNNRVDDTDMWDCSDTNVAAVAGQPLENGATGAEGIKYYTRENKPEGSIAGLLNDGTYVYTEAGVGDQVQADAENKYFPLTNVGQGTKIEYINGSSTSYSTSAHSAVLNTSTDPYDLDTNNSGKILATTAEGQADSTELKVRVWIEGWQQLGNPASSIWSADYINQTFNINMQFACSANK